MKCLSEARQLLWRRKMVEHVKVELNKKYAVTTDYSNALFFEKHVWCIHKLRACQKLLESHFGKEFLAEIDELDLLLDAKDDQVEQSFQWSIHRSVDLHVRRCCAAGPWNSSRCEMSWHVPCAHVPYIILVSRDSMIDWIKDWNQKMWNTTSKIIDKLTESSNIEKIPFLISFNHPSFAQPLLLQPMAIAVHVTCQDEQSRFGEVVSSHLFSR